MRFRLKGERASGKTIGFVPTMGALHEGHLALVRRARAENDLAVVSVFVNPTQFNDKKDLAAYPRDLARDAALVEEAGCDLLFAPEADAIYPAGFQTTVHPGPLAEVLEGYFRPGHFVGVCTVVTKLLNIVQPTRAYFGEKDWQQLKVIERLVADLDLPVSIVGCPTMREPDGLAMSSRNARLTPEAREKARVIPYLLDTAQDLLDTASYEQQTDQPGVLKHWLLSLLESGYPGLVPDYIAVVDSDTLVEPEKIAERALVAIALTVDGVRLIDNKIIVRR